MSARERGFTLIETLIGAAIAAVVIGSLVALAGRMAASADRLSARAGAQSRADRLAERMESEAASAWAVFVPPADVLGASNADGHELDFFAEDGAHRPYAWAYRYDAASRTLARYAYAPGVAATRTESLGAYDAFAASGPYAPSALAVPASPAYDPLFAAATVPTVTHTFPALPYAVGGNELVLVHVQAPGVDRTEALASATAPTAFTVVVTYTPSPPPAATPPAALPTLTAAPTATP